MNVNQTAWQTAESAPLAQAFSVSEINASIADLLMAGLPGVLHVEGEVSNLSVAASGHRYLSLKDSGSTISCALFRGAANRINRDLLNHLRNGDKVIIKASLSVYQPRGNYQLIISDIEPAGFGELAKAFAALKSKLDAAGFTANERKRALPAWPSSIAVVTSSGGAAIRDVLSTLKRRAPFIPVSVYSTLVQGDAAPANIMTALEQANADEQAAVIILARGGGSLEDLHAFNDEQVAMAVVNSRLPVVSGVGHETDFTIVDFVSDYRAPTPTGAAEVSSPDAQALGQSLAKQQQRLCTAMVSIEQQRQQQLQQLARRLRIQHPQQRLQQQNQRLDELTQRLQRLNKQQLQGQQFVLNNLQQRLSNASPQSAQRQAKNDLNAKSIRLTQAMNKQIQQTQQQLNIQQQRLQQTQQRWAAYRQQLKGLEARLTLLSPLGQLSRGYALAFNGEGRLLRHVTEAEVGQRICVRLADGELQAEITQRTLKP